MTEPLQRQLLAIAFIGLTTNLMLRCFDPMLPQISSEMNVSIVKAASLGTAFAMPFALMQPLLGAIADMFGKARLIAVSSVVLVAAGVMGIFADSFAMLVISRIIAGIAAGGVVPNAMALIGDLVRVELRQVALARFLGSALLGNVLGAVVAGALADQFNWRVALTVLVVLLASSVVATLFALRERIAEKGPGFDLGVARRGYVAILANRNSFVCFGAVFVEGALIFGVFPYVAPLFTGGRLTQAGLVIGGFPLGGVVYSLILPWLIQRLKRSQMIVFGMCIVGAMLVFLSFVPPWPAQSLAFLILGVGFYQLHALIQLAVTELAPQARGSAMALHSASYFLGMAVGPILYGFGFLYLGIVPTMAISAVLIVLLGLYASRYMRIGTAPV
jgi:predicted MFS family arabinose efflux permease